MGPCPGGRAPAPPGLAAAAAGGWPRCSRRRSSFAANASRSARALQVCCAGGGRVPLLHQALLQLTPLLLQLQHLRKAAGPRQGRQPRTGSGSGQTRHNPVGWPPVECRRSGVPVERSGAQDALVQSGGAQVGPLPAPAPAPVPLCSRAALRGHPAPASGLPALAEPGEGLWAGPGRRP